MDLIFATSNNHKISEVSALLPDYIHIVGLKDVGITDDIDEPFDTFKENALAKARFVHKKTNRNCFAEDSGICVAALENAPGAHSARFAGLPRDDSKNNELLLSKLAESSDRTAHYNATIALIMNSKEYIFEGKCFGKISHKPIGNNGFGYDPIFIPDGYNQTFGELSIQIKSLLSHRKNAILQMLEFLKSLNVNKQGNA